MRLTTKEIKDMVTDMATNDLAILAKKVATVVYEQIQTHWQFKGSCLKMLEMATMINLVYQIRHKEFGDWESLVNSFPFNSTGVENE